MASPSPPSSAELHLDLSSLPPLSTPSPPTNTLLLTRLTNPAIYTSSNLSALSSLLSEHAGVPLHTFSPLKSMSRIILSLPTTEAAINLRKILDGEEILGCSVKVYFGAPTPVYESVEEEMKARYLAAPDKGKLFFISPPPSPPAGWEMRNEEPPNKMVIAEDLASALGRLRDGNQRWQDDGDGVAAADIMDDSADGEGRNVGGATVVYFPGKHGGRGNLPAVMVQDVSDDGDSPVGEGRRMMTHTARPPVELMDMS